MAQGVATGRFGQSRRTHGLFHGALQGLLVDMMSSCHAGTKVDRAVSRRKHILPAPFPRRVRILLRQRIRQVNLAKTLFHVMFVDQPDFLQVHAQGLDHRLRQHRHPILFALAVAHGDLPIAEIHVLHPQAGAFQQPQAGPVEQFRHQTVLAVHSGQYPPHLFHRQHHRQALRLFRTGDVVHPRQVDVQHLFIQEQQGT